MTTRQYFFTAIACSLLLWSCAEKPSEGPDYMILDEIVYVDEFPKTFQLEPPVRVDVPVVGATKFMILDSLAVFSTNNPDGWWAFFSFPDFEPQGSYIKKGNGPIDFLYSPWVGTKNSFYEKDGELFAVIYDQAKGIVFEMNVGETLAQKQLSMRPIKDLLPTYLFDFTMVDSTTFFCREISHNDTKLERFILQNGSKSVPGILNKLNEAAIMKGEDYNLLGTMTKYNAKTGRFIEMPTDLNYVNIYSLDGSFAKTICVGKN